MNARMLRRFFPYLLVTIAFIDTMSQLPLLSPFAASLGAGAATVGIILAAYSLVNLFGNIFFGPVIDALGTRIAVFIGLLVAGVAVLFYAVVSAPWQLMVVRVIHGAAGGLLIPAVYAHVGRRASGSSISPSSSGNSAADSSTSRPSAGNSAADSSAGRATGGSSNGERSTGRAMGFAGTAVAVAATIGPIAGGIIGARFGARSAFLVVGSLLVVSALVFFGAAGTSQTRARSVLQWRLTALRRPGFHDTLLSVFSLTFAGGTLAYTFPFLIAAAGMDSGHTGAFFGLFSLAAIFVMVTPLSRISDRIGRQPVIRIGALLVATALVTLSVASGRMVVSLAMIFYGLGYGTMFPAMCAAVVDATGEQDRGSGFGIFYAAFSLGTVLGPVIAGLLVGSATGIPFWLAAAVLITLQFVIAILRRNPRPVQQRT